MNEDQKRQIIKGFNARSTKFLPAYFEFVGSNTNTEENNSETLNFTEKLKEGPIKY